MNKVTGLDSIPARLLKNGAPVISECLTHIITHFFSSGVPDDWKTPRVVSLLKYGNREEIDNYRPISILPVTFKIAEKVVYNFFSYLNANNLLSSCQSGFRKNFSTVDEIRRNMDDALLTGAVLNDFKKAFDTIGHRILLNKLKRCGVCKRTFLWFSSYLQGLSKHVEVDKVPSSPLVIASGVPQGINFGPRALYIAHK